MFDLGNSAFYCPGLREYPPARVICVRALRLCGPTLFCQKGSNSQSTPRPRTQRRVSSSIQRFPSTSNTYPAYLPQPDNLRYRLVFG
eukprot:1317476-Amorphochlora_amoeboformis.AAC.3